MVPCTNARVVLSVAERRKEAQHHVRKGDDDADDDGGGGGGDGGDGGGCCLAHTGSRVRLGLVWFLPLFLSFRVCFIFLLFFRTWGTMCPLPCTVAK